MLPLLGSRPELRVTPRYPHPAGDRALGVALWLWNSRVEGHGCTLQGPLANLERKVIGHWRWRERVSFLCHLLVFRRELDAGARLPGAAQGLGCRAFASRAPGSRGGKREGTVRLRRSGKSPLLPCGDCP